MMRGTITLSSATPAASFCVIIIPGGPGKEKEGGKPSARYLINTNKTKINRKPRSNTRSRRKRRAPLCSLLCLSMCMYRQRQDSQRNDLRDGLVWHLASHSQLPKLLDPTAKYPEEQNTSRIFCRYYFANCPNKKPGRPRLTGRPFCIAPKSTLA